MDLFNLRAVIGLDTSEYDRGLKNSSSLLSKTASGIKSTASAIGKTVAAGITAGAAAFGALAKASLDARGELEQNLGGSEQVFQNFARLIQSEGAEAYKNLGLSQSDYLANANRMGALFQGSGFTVVESLNMTRDAMQRAADVASIMGLDTSAAMEAIAGAAKGNFTMMDNLGVAINDTAIAEYALSKGITKSTRDMSTQEKVGLAMELFMERTAYAAGNYARENETLAGSLGTAKAAFDNFLSGAGGAEQVVDSFINVANVVSSTVLSMAPDLINGVTSIINGLIPVIPPLLSSLLPVVIEGAISLTNGLVTALPELMNVIVSALPALIGGIVGALPEMIPVLIDGVASMLTTLVASFPQLIQPIIDSLPEIIISIVNALMTNLPALIEGGVQMIQGLVAAIPQITLALIQALPEVIATIISTLLGMVPQLIVAGGQILLGLLQGMWDMITQIPALLATIFMGIVEGIMDLFDIHSPSKVMMEIGNNIMQGLIDGIAALIDLVAGLWESIKTTAINIWNSIKAFILSAWENIKTGVSNLAESLGDAISNVWETIKSTAVTVWNAIKTFIFNAWDNIKTGVSNAIQSVSNTVSTVFNNVKSFVSTVWNNIKLAIDLAWNNIKNGVSTAINSVKSTVSTVFNTVKTSVSNVWNGIKDTISGVWDTIYTKVSTAVYNVWTSVSTVFNTVKTKVTTIWNGIKTAIQTPIEKARDLVSDAIEAIKGFFDFDFKWPELKLPHFSFSGSWNPFDWPDQFPKLSVEWYNNAMNNPMLLRGATIFGMQDGRLLGGGDAGGEVVAGANTVARLIYDAVRDAMGNMGGGIVVNQNIYSEAKTAADLMQEARWEAERAVLMGV